MTIVTVDNYTINEACAIDGSNAILYNRTPIVIPLDSTSSITTQNVESGIESSTNSYNGTGFTPIWRNLTDASTADRLYVVQLDNGNLNVWLKEFPDSEAKLLIITKNCVKGNCLCKHVIGDRPAQLHPCRLFVKLFLRGDVDPDWFYLLWGFFFGFKVIDSNCNSAYSPKYFKKKSS